MDYKVFTKPVHVTTWMGVFLALVAGLAAFLVPQLKHAFMANAAFNGVIVFVLAVGIAVNLRQVWRLQREVLWIESFQQRPEIEDLRPVLLAPMARLLASRKRGQIHLSPASMRTLLDSVQIRLEEQRDLSRYLIGLAIFLGLLGTFWGLLDTVGSVGGVIKSLRTGAEAGVLFDELKAGLSAPLAGMGLSFSSSLFGIAGSLILGFLDLQVGQAQRRFRNEVESWLGSRTGAPETPAALLATGNPLADRFEQLSAAMADGASNNRAATQALSNLAEGIQGLVQHMRSEQQMIRDWVEAQAAREKDLKRLIDRLTADQITEP